MENNRNLNESPKPEKFHDEDVDDGMESNLLYKSKKGYAFLSKEDLNNDKKLKKAFNRFANPKNDAGLNFFKKKQKEDYEQTTMRGDYFGEVSYGYLHSLIYPERSKGSRIPSIVPTPSSTFQQREQLTITPNASGNFALQWIPQCYNSVSGGNYDLYVNTDATLSGSTILGGGTWTPQSATRFAGDYFNTVRLVSASMMISYIGRADAHSGVIGCAHDISATVSSSADTQYSNFGYIDDKLYSKTTEPANGLKSVYIPKDPSDENWCAPNIIIPSSGSGKSSSVRFLVYGQNLPNAQCIRVDFVRNFEGNPNPSIADIASMGYTLSPPMFNSLNIARHIVDCNLVVTDLKDDNKRRDVALELVKRELYKLS